MMLFKNKLTIIGLLISLALWSQQAQKKSKFAIKIDTLLQDKINIRGLLVTKTAIYYAADKNRVGLISVDNSSKTEQKIKYDSLQVDFRSCAKTKNAFFALSVANPALLYKFSNDLLSKELVYKEIHSDVFYDSMQFYDNFNGIAIGDPIDNKISIITTNDGGTTWRKNDSSSSPELAEGEAFFASSNTNIVIKNGQTWLVSGGKKSRIFYSKNKGKTWKVFDTPINQGAAMTGIFTADFYDENIGVIAGGNYELATNNTKNKAITFDGGKTWKLIADNTGFGYASCVQFFPKSGGKNIISVGLTGVFISDNFGDSWVQISTDTSLYTVRCINKKTAIAAGKGKIIKISFLK